MKDDGGIGIDFLKRVWTDWLVREWGEREFILSIESHPTIDFNRSFYKHARTLESSDANDLGIHSRHSTIPVARSCVDILKHEMAHQYISEFSPSGEKLRTA